MKYRNRQLGMMILMSVMWLQIADAFSANCTYNQTGGPRVCQSSTSNHAYFAFLTLPLFALYVGSGECFGLESASQFPRPFHEHLTQGSHQRSGGRYQKGLPRAHQTIVQPGEDLKSTSVSIEEESEATQLEANDGSLSRSVVELLTSPDLSENEMGKVALYRLLKTGLFQGEQCGKRAFLMPKLKEFSEVVRGATESEFFLHFDRLLKDLRAKHRLYDKGAPRARAKYRTWRSDKSQKLQSQIDGWTPVSESDEVVESDSEDSSELSEVVERDSEEGSEWSMGGASYSPFSLSSY